MPGPSEALHKQEAITVYLSVPKGLLRESYRDSGFTCACQLTQPQPWVPYSHPAILGLNRRRIHQRAMA